MTTTHAMQLRTEFRAVVNPVDPAVHSGCQTFSLIVMHYLRLFAGSRFFFSFKRKSLTHATCQSHYRCNNMVWRALSFLLVLLIAVSTYAESGLKETSHGGGGGADFRTIPKNILFSSVGGGASHNSWIIRILDQLHKRGHNVFFASTVSISITCKSTFI